MELTLNMLDELIVKKKSSILELEQEIEELREKKIQIENKNKYRKFNFHTDMPKFASGKLVIAVFDRETDKKLIDALTTLGIMVIGRPDITDLELFYKCGLGRSYGSVTYNRTEYDHLSYYAKENVREIVVFE